MIYFWGGEIYSKKMTLLLLLHECVCWRGLDKNMPNAHSLPQKTELQLQLDRLRQGLWAVSGEKSTSRQSYR